MSLTKIVNGEEVEMSAQEEADTRAEWAENAAPVVPPSVSMPQARLALLAAGKLTAVETAINALSSPDREQAQIWWEYSSNVEREHPYVVQLAPALGLDAAGLDALFIAARGM